MTIQFFDLPAEIRLKIYEAAFGSGRVLVLDAGRQDAGDSRSCPSLLPGKVVAQHEQQRSAQLLRVCKSMLYEARPLLYAGTTFHTVHEAFAGRLPEAFTNDHPSASHVRHLTWQLSCDLLKSFRPEDVKISQNDLSNLQTLELKCQSQDWRGSFCGEWCDRESFIRGRSSTIQLAKLLKGKMEDIDKPVTLIEDRACLGYGRVIFRLTTSKISLSEHEAVI